MKESRRIRRLRIVVNLSLSLIAEGDLPFAEALAISEAARRLAETLFPGKGLCIRLALRPEISPVNERPLPFAVSF